ncbi:MAG: hypothetical protein ACR2OB_13890 [Solirubrobacteraceae bacterium]
MSCYQGVPEAVPSQDVHVASHHAGGHRSDGVEESLDTGFEPFGAWVGRRLGADVGKVAQVSLLVGIQLQRAGERGEDGF